MIILAIDPGAKQSGYILWPSPGELGLMDAILFAHFAHTDNDKLLSIVRKLPIEVVLAIEQIRGYGIVAGDDTFDTCEWRNNSRKLTRARAGRY